MSSRPFHVSTTTTTSAPSLTPAPAGNASRNGARVAASRTAATAYSASPHAAAGARPEQQRRGTNEITAQRCDDHGRESEPAQRRADRAEQPEHRHEPDRRSRRRARARARRRRPRRRQATRAADGSPRRRARRAAGAALARHEDERERRRDPRRDQHPRRERDDEAPELLADVAAVGVSEHRVCRAARPPPRRRPRSRRRRRARSRPTSRRDGRPAPASRPARVSGTDVTRARAEAVTEITADAARYA